MIKVFLDTNILFSDKRKIFNKIEFGGEYIKVLKKAKLLNKFSDVIKIFIPEIAVLEFKHNCIEEFYRQREKIDSFNADLEAIFGNNLIYKTKLSWDSVEEYKQHLDSEMNIYLSQNVDNFTLLETPDCFKKIITKAVSKQPLFKETKSGSKTYYDAGLKDNLILETCLTNLLEDEIGIIFTKDNDFDYEQSNLHIVRTPDDFERKVRELCPDYAIYDILNELDNQKVDILSYLEVDYNSSLSILGFTKEICEYDEEEDIIKFVIVVTINNDEKQLIITYNRYMKSIIDVIEKE